MGACVSAGGSATSGATLTGPMIASAIRAAALHSNQQRKPSGACLSRGFKALPEMVRENEQFQIAYAAAPPNDSIDMTVTSYAPQLFCELRRLEGVSDLEFAEEWKLPPSARAALGEGRSQAMFLKSKNNHFLAKTIALAEVDALLKVIDKMVHHIQTYQHSLLMRFAMVLKVETVDDVGYLLVFADIFSTCKSLNEKWDIKGRIPKPGKFRHFPASTGKKDSAAARSLLYRKAVMMRRERHSNAEAPRVEEGGSGSHALTSLPEESEASVGHAVPTQKDKELTRLFWLLKDGRDDVVAQLQADFELLNECGLMDYSVLIGVAYKEEATITDMRAAAHSRDLSVNDTTAAETRPNARSASDATGRSKYHIGVQSVMGEETYYIGIIDMLTEYSAKKKVANFCKTFLWEPETLSTIPPPAYKARISDYVNRIFVSPPPDVEYALKVIVTKQHDKKNNEGKGSNGVTRSAAQNEPRGPRFANELPNGSAVPHQPI